MENPNSFSQIKIISNPVKSVVCTHTFTNDDNVAYCKLFKELLDLSKGVWQVAVSHIILVNDSRNSDLKTVFDLKTNLSYTYQQIKGRAVSTNECIASVEARCLVGDFVLFSPKTKIFFTVNNSPTDYFKLSLTENELLTQNRSYKVKAEVRLLFQRMI